MENCFLLNFQCNKRQYNVVFVQKYDFVSEKLIQFSTVKRLLEIKDSVLASLKITQVDTCMEVDLILCDGKQLNKWREFYCNTNDKHKNEDLVEPFVEKEIDYELMFPIEI
jgi:hypothetical protein